MPETKLESVVFTAVTAWIMVYIMTLYNTVLAAQSFTNITFLSALKGMWVEYVLIFLCAFFISGKLAPKLAFRVVKQGDRPVFISFAIQIFTVVFQVAFASIIGVYHGYGFILITNKTVDKKSSHNPYMQDYARFFVQFLIGS